MANALYDPPPVVSREKALEILGPHMNDLRDSILTGWDAWTKMLSEDEERPITLTKTARARFIHDYAVKAATARFDDRPGIRLRHEHNSLLVIFGTEVILQVRHLDEGLMRCYTPTRRQDEILRQEFCLPEVAEEATLLTLGYTVCEHENTINKIVITCQWHSSHVWPPIGLLDDGDDMFFAASSPKTPPPDDDTAKTVIVPLEPGPAPLRKTESEKS